MQHVNVGDLIREKRFYSGWDEEFQAYEIDEQSEDAVRRIPARLRSLADSRHPREPAAFRPRCNASGVFLWAAVIGDGCVLFMLEG